MGAGGLRKAGEEGAGGGISKRGRSREKWEKLRNIGTIFRNRRSTRRREPLWKGAGTGSAGCGRQCHSVLGIPVFWVPPYPAH